MILYFDTPVQIWSLEIYKSVSSYSFPGFQCWVGEAVNLISSSHYRSNIGELMTASDVQSLFHQLFTDQNQTHVLSDQTETWTD